ncbi:MAG TPA: class I SAM-dependent methyltransferase [Vicinamibacterales bacterium]|nr:class I SAM-dependent methyltransferase [Vicinamibacterales bacterium]
MGSDHYSYSAYADPQMASGFDAKRFGGPIGNILLQDQERVLTAFLGDVSGQRVLDMATGTGRAALALARRGAIVTGVDASREMLTVARTRAADAGLTIDFAEGDAHALVFADRSFDAVVCLRMLMHVPDWRKALGELCRVTQHRLVVDYPAIGSAAALQAIWRHAALRMGQRVEAYRVFRGSDVARELDRHGFRITSTHKQFVLPIALHKAVGSAGFTRGLEGVLAGAGMLRLTGSPVTIAAERCAS